MLRKTVFSLFFCSTSLLSAQTIELHHAPLSSIQQFINNAVTKPTSAQHAARPTAPVVKPNTLQQIARSEQADKTLIRYQQFYRGIPVIGAQVISEQGKATKSEVNGVMLEQIQLNTTPSLSQNEAIKIASTSFFSSKHSAAINEQAVQLQIRALADEQLALVFLVSFKTVDEHGKPAWPFFIIDAQNGTLLKQWNNIKTYADSGPGGNEKTHEYWYGQDGLPALEVSQKDGQCVMDNGKVRLINLSSQWDWSMLMTTPFAYPCGNNQEEYINGAYSPVNDAYYFGQVIVDMYQNWYGVNALQLSDGTPMQLLMRVHFGQGYDNAFWDGQAMSFGDGEEFYPLVSLDVAGHEVTHGFTEQHSNLEYHDQSGALNESLSDMAGQASRAYLLEQSPQLYGKAYLNPTEVTWGIGETVVRDSFGKALRFMDYPSSDGSSADCFSREVAQTTGTYCAISYDEVVAYANSNLDLEDRQNFIVHTGSGVFNKAFYLLAQQVGIKKAYQLMLIANSKYWTPTTDFSHGACGVLHAATDLAFATDPIVAIFRQVGIDTSLCTK